MCELVGIRVEILRRKNSWVVIYSHQYCSPQRVSYLSVRHFLLPLSVVYLVVVLCLKCLMMAAGIVQAAVSSCSFFSSCLYDVRLCASTPNGWLSYTWSVSVRIKILTLYSQLRKLLHFVDSDNSSRLSLCRFQSTIEQRDCNDDVIFSKTVLECAGRGTTNTSCFQVYLSLSKHVLQSPSSSIARAARYSL